MMETLEEENFGVSISSPSDAEFDAVVGYLEDIIMDDDFQLIQRSFMEKHYQEFEDTEENKLVYTSIFNEYAVPSHGCFRGRSRKQTGRFGIICPP